jgi:hypothetical protein
MSNGNLHTIKCRIFSEVEGKNKVLFAKWDYLVKHVGCRKVAKDIGTHVKKGDWYYIKLGRHAKNQKLFTSHGRESIATQVAHGVARKNAKKVVNFVIMLNLLQQGCPMLEYGTLKPLFKFLHVIKTTRNIIQ